MAKKYKVIGVPWQILIDECIIGVWRGIRARHINYLTFGEGNIKTVCFVIKNFMFIRLRLIKENIVQKIVPIEQMLLSYLKQEWERITQDTGKDRGIILMGKEIITTQRENGEGLRKKLEEMVNVNFVNL